MMLKVGPYNFSLVLSGDLDDTLNGETDAETQTITIRKGLHHTVYKVVLLHEVMHAIYYSYGHKDRNDEETTVNFLSTGLIEVLQNNKWLRDALGVENV